MKLESVLEMLPESYIVDKVNSNPATTWSAGINDRWANAAIEDKVNALGTEVYEQAPFVCRVSNRASYSLNLTCRIRMWVGGGGRRGQQHAVHRR